MAILVDLAFSTFTTADTVGEIRVIDGDTLVYGDQKIRLACVDAPEKGQAGWLFSKTLLETKVSGKSLNIKQVGKDAYGRIVGIVTYQEKNVNLEMLGEGGAMTNFDNKRHCNDEKDSFIAAEEKAIAAQVGIWSPPAYPPIPPSTFRKLKSFLK